MQCVASLPSRIHVADTLAPGMILTLPAAASHHLTRVLRVAAGDCIVVFNDGVEYAATVTGIDRAGVAVKLAAGSVVDRESPLACTLAQVVASGDRMDITLQKAVELGVNAVQPLFSERSVVRLVGERAAKRSTHWRQVMVSACEQCGRNKIPGLSPPLTLTAWLDGLAAVSGRESRILLSPYATTQLAHLSRPQGITLLAGPEGGFSDAEVAHATDRGFVSVRLGPRVLRTETAALAALAAMNVLWGDF